MARFILPSYVYVSLAGQSSLGSDVIFSVYTYIFAYTHTFFFLKIVRYYLLT